MATSELWLLGLGCLSSNIFPSVHSHGPYGKHRVGPLDTHWLLITLHHNLFSSEDPFTEEESQVEGGRLALRHTVNALVPWLPVFQYLESPLKVISFLLSLKCLGQV